MNPSVASVICACGIAGLFYLNRDRSIHTSKALWLPTLYILILGSRTVSTWLGINEPATGTTELEGSPIDAAVYGVLLMAAICVLAFRAKRTLRFLVANWPILLYFAYCLLSVAWSYHPDVAFKRWIKSLDDLAMCLVIVTDRQPIEAIKRLVSRVGFVLLPASLLLIKYYPALGRGYTPDGAPMNTGVTTNKNVLGLMLYVVTFYTLWQVLTLWRAKSEPGHRRRLLAQGTLLVFGAVNLKMADSKTSIACLLIASGLMFASTLRSIRRRPARIHILSLAVFLVGGFVMLAGGEGMVARALGRNSNLSGRTEIWAALIPTVSNPVVGAGFESYWISPNVRGFQDALKTQGWWQPESLNEAHNGYLEVYLNLGIVGVCLILWILISGYRHAVAAFRRSPLIVGPMVAYIVTSAFYNITEAGFRDFDIVWVFFLVAVMSATGVAAGIFGQGAPSTARARGNKMTNRPHGSRPGPIGVAVHALWGRST